MNCKFKKNNYCASLQASLIGFLFKFSHSPAQAVKIFIALAVYCTFGLQFYVCLEIVWNGVKENFTKRPLIVNYTLR